MDNLSDWSEAFFESLASLWVMIVEILPTIIGAILIFLIGWLIAKLASKMLEKLLTYLKFDELSNKVNTDELLKKANINSTPSKLFSKFVYYLIMLLVFITAADTLGWDSITNEISKLISFLPKLLSAIVIFIIGVFIASSVRDFINGATASVGAGTGKIIGSFVFYLLIILITLTSLKQAGMDTSIITSNMLLILSAILLSASISYGFASKDILSNILAGYVGRDTYRKGTTLEVDGIRGEVIDSGSIGLTLRQSNGDKVIIPASTLLKHTVKIIES